jgi:hypothetical protein
MSRAVLLSAVTGEFTQPDRLSDFGFTEPFATNFVRLLMDEARAK